MKMVYYPYPKAPFLSPEEVIEDLGLKPGERVLDFGAGAGYWALPMAQKVGKTGHVFVTDAKTENLSVIKNKALKLGLDNLSYFEAPYHGRVMPVQTKVDLILCSNVLSLLESFEDVLTQAKKLAQKGTRLVVVDWNMNTKVGPIQDSRIDVEKLILAAAKKGFEFKKLLSAGTHHTGLYFIYE